MGEKTGKLIPTTKIAWTSMSIWKQKDKVKW